ncbi:hypothetical protein ALT721_2400001 [Alteromonas alvinellae]
MSCFFTIQSNEHILHAFEAIMSNFVRNVQKANRFLAVNSFT